MSSLIRCLTLEEGGNGKESSGKEELPRASAEALGGSTSQLQGGEANTVGNT